jgi:hypothetical protein
MSQRKKKALVCRLRLNCAPAYNLQQQYSQWLRVSSRSLVATQWCTVRWDGLYIGFAAIATSGFPLSAVDSHLATEPVAVVEPVEYIVGRVFVDVEASDRPLGVEVLAPFSPADVVSLLQLLRKTLPPR